MTDIPTAGAPQPAPRARARRPGRASRPRPRHPPRGTAPPAARPTRPTRPSARRAAPTSWSRPAPPNGAQPPADVSDGTVLASATPQTAPAGEESPLDVGWTGAVPVLGHRPRDRRPHAATPAARGTSSTATATTAAPRRPTRATTSSSRRRPGSGASATSAGATPATRTPCRSAPPTRPGSRAVLVVCDGVSMATDSHIASLAAATAARAVLDQPFPKGVGTPDSWASGAGARADERRHPRQRGRRGLGRRGRAQPAVVHLRGRGRRGRRHRRGQRG